MFGESFREADMEGSLGALDRKVLLSRLQRNFQTLYWKRYYLIHNQKYWLSAEIITLKLGGNTD